MADDQTILDAIHEAKVLGFFKKFCDEHRSASEMMRLRDILSRSANPITTTEHLVKLESNEHWSRNDVERLYELIKAYLSKSSFRKPVGDRLRMALLERQGCRCAICGSPISHRAHADHIVPFKYVGDALDNNIQLLCPECNTKKNASIDYQIRYLLNLV